ncbi:MAG TPA: ABC transporter permease, partial [Steroidobacteraceae bacterium]|nr:ABC transporter permease [Steroidobacteraceae bacterium]
MAATGDRTVNEGSLWLASGADAPSVARNLQAALALGDSLQLRTTTEVRERSLANFDRAFLVTYALEAIAVLIGLLGVGVTAAATALARRAEFGMLRHVGLLRRELAAMLAGEGLLMSAIGVAFALVLGGALSLVLVHVVNRQSFLWSIDFAIPWLQLALLALALVFAAAVTTVVSGRAALGGDALRAVREDW